MSCGKVGKILRTETLSVKYNLMQLCHDYRNKHDYPRVGGTQPIFGYSWAAEDLKTWPCSGQKIRKIHTLFRTTPSVLLPWSWLGQRTKRTLEQSTGLGGCATLLSKRQRGVGGIVVSIAAFQAVDPGSIPGRRTFFLYYFPFLCFYFIR